MEDGEGLGKLGRPIQRKAYDLTKAPKDLRVKGGKAPPVHFDKTRSDNRQPDDIMRFMGFDPTKNMNPLQFLIAVMNDDLDALFLNPQRRERYERKGGLAMNYRIEAAKTASRYLHMELPKVTVQENLNGFGDDLANAILSGNDRITKRTMIIEEVTRTSPDIPLAPASYPPAFALEDHRQEIEDVGDIDYDPDNE